MTEDKRSWGELAGGCRVSIARVPAPAESAPTDVFLDIVFRNENPVAVEFPRFSLWFDYDFSVLTGTGAAVPLTDFGKQQRANLENAAAALMRIEPGRHYQSTVDLSRLYDMTHAQGFSVQASKTFRDPKSLQFVTVRSKRLRA